jgi:O-antigen/teichoic acid export membrane protein/O-antigen ligase
MHNKPPPKDARSLLAADGTIPVKVLLGVGVVVLALTLAATVWVGVALIVLALFISVCITLWIRDRHDLLVTVVALLLFWMPFQVTFTRVNVSPQEITVYIVCLVAALFERRGIARWVGSLLSSASAVMRLLCLVFVLACLQSVTRIAHRDILAIFNSLHSIVLFPLLLGFLVTYTMRTRQAQRTLLQSFVAGAVIFAVFALILQFWGIDVSNGAVAGRLGSQVTFISQYHPNNLALYFVMALAFIPAIVGEAIRSYRSGANRAFDVVLGVELVLVFSVMLVLIALWLTYSRGALAALCLGIMVALLILATLGKGIPRALAIGSIGLGLVGLGGLFIQGGTSLLGRYGTLLNVFQLSADPDVAFRTQLYQRALEIISQHPLTGIGLQQFANGSTVPYSPHNTYLDIWVGTGLYGALAFTLALAFGIIAAASAVRRQSRQGRVVETLYALGYIIALVAFAAQGFVEAYDATLRIAPIVWMLAISSAVGTQFHERRTKRAVIGPAATPENLDPPAIRGTSEPGETADDTRRPEPVAALAEGDDNQHSDTAREAVWRLQTMALPTWKMRAGGAEAWQVQTLPMPTLTPDVSTHKTIKTRAMNGTPSSDHSATMEPSASEASAHDDTGESLLRRTSSNFLWNQLYMLWFFGTSFLLSVIITRGLSAHDYGMFATLTTIIGTITFLCAFGLEDTATVFLPRIVGKDGERAAGTLIRRLLVWRVIVVVFCGIVLTAALFFATPYLSHFGIVPQLFDAHGASSPLVRAIVVSLYLIGGSISTLQTAFYYALLRSRVVLVVGGVSQLASIVTVFALLQLGWGVDGVFAGLAAVELLSVVAFLLPLMRLLFAQGKIRSVTRGETRRLMIGAWLTNITSSALGKQMDILIMTAFLVSIVQVGYYNLAYQLGSTIGVVLISGLGGVGLAAMSAAAATGGLTRLAAMWRANVMLQVLLASPLQIICFVFADQIVSVIYGPRWVGAAFLLRIFLAFSMLGRLTGGGASQAALYVLGRQRSVLFVRWSALAINVILDITLIQVYGAVGVMFATGFTQLWVGVMEFLLLRRHLGAEYPFTYMLRVTGVSVVAALLLTWWPTKGLVGLAIDFALFAVLLAIGMWALKTDERNDLTELMLASPRLKSLVDRVNAFLPHRKVAAAPMEVTSAHTR